MIGAGGLGRYLRLDRGRRYRPGSWAHVYETRILGASDGRDTGTETLNDLGGAAGSDVIFFEGIRDLGDLDFSRTSTLAREGDDRTLEVEFSQYRGIDDEDTVDDESARCHAYGAVELFNQFSLSQSDLYKVEEPQITEESEPARLGGPSYVFGDVTESAGDRGYSLGLR